MDRLGWRYLHDQLQERAEWYPLLDGQRSEHHHQLQRGSGRRGIAVDHANGCELHFAKSSTWDVHALPECLGITEYDQASRSQPHVASVISTLRCWDLWAPRISGGPNTFAYADVEVAATTGYLHTNVTSAAQRLLHDELGRRAVVAVHL